CWTNNTQITEWVGVEPNSYFAKNLADMHDSGTFSFSITTKWLKGENVDVEPESFDYVVGTHVLCSVDDVEQVLKQISRALKPGGQYLFMEHVQANPETNLYYYQKVFEPLFYIVGNGCQFKKTWNYLNSATGLQGFDVKLTHKDAPHAL